MSESKHLDLSITASAMIEPGATTNRVRVKRAPKRKPAPKRFRADPNRPGGWRTVCISLPPGDLAALDAAAQAAQMSRSHFLRQAARHFAEKCKP